jgi:tetratricopeptide (TPR) repeat protein
VGAEVSWERFLPGEAPLLLRKLASGEATALEFQQAAGSRVFLLGQGQLLGFASTHPQEQLSPELPAEAQAAVAAQALARLAGAEGRWCRGAANPPATAPIPLDRVILEALCRITDVGPVLELLGAQRPFVRQTLPSELPLSPLEAFLWERLAQPMTLAELQKLAPEQAQPLARAFAGLACLGVLAPLAPPPAKEKPRFPPANPALRERLARIAKEGGLSVADYQRTISEEEMEQAHRDKEQALQILAQGGDERQAFKLLSRAVSILPDPTSLVRLAEIEVTNPLWRERALAHLKQALEMDPRCTPAWLALANYWGLRGDTGKQRRCLENILKYDPQNRDVREALAHLAG